MTASTTAPITTTNNKSRSQTTQATSFRPFNQNLRFNTHCAVPLSSHVIDEHSVYDSYDLSSFSSMQSGWGSNESRKSCRNLASLANDVVVVGGPSGTIRTVGAPMEGHGWGYFADTNDDDEENFF